ncbi:MAG: hypothetical protein ACXVXZ_13490 [Mycobacteriaceae bacterium]
MAGGPCAAFFSRLADRPATRLAKEGFDRPPAGLTLDWSLQALAPGQPPNQHDQAHPLTSFNVVFGRQNTSVVTDNLVFLLYQDGRVSYQGCASFGGKPGASASMALHDPWPGQPAALLVDPVFQNGEVYQNTNNVLYAPVRERATEPVLFPPTRLPAEPAPLPPIVDPSVTEDLLNLDQQPGAPCTRPQARCLQTGYFVIDTAVTQAVADVRVIKSGVVDVSGRTHDAVELPRLARRTFRLAVAISGRDDQSYSNQVWLITP